MGVRTLAIVAACLACGAARPTIAEAQATYLYNLASFGGPLEYNSVRVTVDQETEEVYIIYQNLIRIYSPSGMEIFSFGENLDLGQILDVAVDQTGDIFLLSFRDSQSTVTRCNFRGMPIGALEVTGLPDGPAFVANRMILRDGTFYFASQAGVLVTDATGRVRSRIELASLLDEEERVSGAEITGLAVDEEGNLYFTVPTLFRVFRHSPDGSVVSFGRPGSAPGRFGVVAGIVTDGQGNLLVTDRLRCVVMVFDRDFTFVSEFGYRGAEPENLVVPTDIAIDLRGRVYVSQMRSRGVSVFALERR